MILALHMHPLSNVGQTLSPLKCDAVIAVSSSVATLLVSSTLFFVIGYVCRCLCHKQKIPSSDLANQTVDTLPNVIYEDIIPKSDVHQNKKHDVELKENMAYTSIAH